MSVSTRGSGRAIPLDDRTAASAPWRVVCPACGLPTDVLEELSLDGAAGPVPHLRTGCPAGHHFVLAEDHPRLRPWRR